ncbi:tumor necrosis factor receptor superfamily member 1A [Labrus bergylta]|uniref:tumor necrosis factor receptor superfamily member 1A n=1 Tax=Labrus bergylta TaxID=56723 RepID=UPI0033142119
MEGGVHTGKWIPKASAGTILLLMCMFIPTLTALLQLSEELKCQDDEYLNEEIGVCCNKCHPGFKLVKMCLNKDQRSNCTACPKSQFNEERNYTPNCRTCKICRKSWHEIEESPCDTKHNTVCRCEDGYYKSIIDSENSECIRCSRCGQNKREKQKCTPEKNTECECTENYQSVKNRCEPCKNCSAGCKHLCPQTTKTPEPGERYLVKILGVFFAVAMVMSGVLVAITYIATKRSTKNKLLKSSSETSDDSLDSCESGLIYKEQHSNSSVEAAPISPVRDQERSDLLGSPPLEIKIPDLIYMVLDLVPVLKVKQLMRALGVRDSEIEHAELDYRSSREAHYQMLRVWAERGSRAGGGGCGGMLHRPLLQELLDKLREMNLGRAAEELETKYGIQ